MTKLSMISYMKRRANTVDLISKVILDIKNSLVETYNSLGNLCVLYFWK